MRRKMRRNVNMKRRIDGKTYVGKKVAMYVKKVEK